MLKKIYRRWAGRRTRRLPIAELIGVTREFHRIVVTVRTPECQSNKWTAYTASHGDSHQVTSTTGNGVVSIEIKAADFAPLAVGSKSNTPARIELKGKTGSMNVGRVNRTHPPVTMPLSILSDGKTRVSVRITADSTGIALLHSNVWLSQ